MNLDIFVFQHTLTIYMYMIMNKVNEILIMVTHSLFAILCRKLKRGIYRNLSMKKGFFIDVLLVPR